MDKCYNFTTLAVQLNEPEEGVCPTDARLRPDQRLMEEGLWDDANKVKVQIEDKQRAARRKRESEAAEAAAQGNGGERVFVYYLSIQKYETKELLNIFRPFIP